MKFAPSSIARRDSYGRSALTAARPGVIADRARRRWAISSPARHKLPKFHTAGINWGRDLPEPDLVADIRNVVTGDTSPDGKGTLELCRGIGSRPHLPVAHQVFRSTTSHLPGRKRQGADHGNGCYGIGVSRIVAAAIEQNFDERGITLPAGMAPFQVAIRAIGIKKSEAVRSAAEQLYEELTSAGVEVLLDDRDERPGVMFADLELIGIPHRSSSAIAD